jgi:hypothetical protein
MDSSNTNGRPFHASVNGKYRKLSRAQASTAEQAL